MKTLRTLANLLLTCAACAAALAAFGASSAAAATVSGTWSCCGTESGASPQSWAITESGGSLSGTASAEYGAFSPISGKISGSSVEIVTGPYYGSTYSATFIGTISGETMSGTWTSSADQKGTWTATRGSAGEEAAKKKLEEEEEKAKALRKAAIQLNCDSFYPGLPTEYFQCTAQVADASGKAPAEVPTGTVSFAVNSGGVGAIVGTKTCTLAPSQTGGASSFCSIEYVPPSGGLELGVQPPITASYSGSSVFAKAGTGPSDQMVQPLSPKEVFESLCVATFLPACQGVVPPPNILQEACFSLAASQGEAAAAENACTLATMNEDVTVAEGEPSITATADCPAASGDGLSSCELQAYVEGKSLDPDVKAELEYETNYAAYLSQLAVAKAAYVQQLKDYITGAPIEGNEQERKETETRRSELVDKFTGLVKEDAEILAHRGKSVVDGYEPIDPEAIEKACQGAANKEACLTFVGTINDTIKSFVTEMSDVKARLGVNVKFTPPAKAKGARVASTRRSTPRPPQRLVYASGEASVAAGHSGQVRLVIPAFVRSELKAAFAKHQRILKATLVVHVMTATGASATRTIPLTIKLVAKKPRPAAKTKKK